MPRDLKAAFGHRTEIRFSLRTLDPQTAFSRWATASERWQELIQQLRTLIDMGKFPFIAGMPEGLAEYLQGDRPIRRYELKVDRDDPNRIQINLHRDEVRRLGMDLLTGLAPLDPWSAESPPAAETREIARPSSPLTTVAAAGTPSRTFSVVARDYVDERKGDWTPKTLAEYQATLALFEFVLGDPPFQTIRKEHLRAAKKKIRLLPPNRNKSPNYRQLPLAQLIKQQERLKENGQEIAQLDDATFNKLWGVLQTFFKWAVTNGDAGENYAEGMALPRNKSKRKKSRLAFTDAEFVSIFGSAFFLPGGYAYPVDYWGPVPPAATQIPPPVAGSNSPTLSTRKSA